MSEESAKTVSVSPPWKKLIQTALQQVPSGPHYLSVATVNGENLPVNQLFPFRGFAGEDRDGETGWESDLLTSTFDKRSFELGEETNKRYEATWIIGDQHFRIRGRLHAFGGGHNVTSAIDNHIARKKLSKIINEEEDLGDKISQATKSFLRRIKSQLHHGRHANKFDWEAERLRQWHDLTDDARASYAWSTPAGQPKSEEEERIESLEINESDAEGWFKNSDEAKQALLEQAYENFSVLFLEVLELDHVASSSQRTLYRVDEHGQWVAQPVNA